MFATDTVGFVRKLPHQLVTAFKTTLDVVRDADLLVHVVDGQGLIPKVRWTPFVRCSKRLVRAACPNCSSSTRPIRVMVFNALREDEGSVAVSAHSGFNLDHLTAVIGDRTVDDRLAELMIPWDRGDVLAAVHREGQVLTESAEENGMRLKARLEPASLGALREYVLDVEGGLPFESDDEDAW